MPLLELRVYTRHFLVLCCTHRLKMTAEVFQTSEALIAGLTGVRPLPSVTTQVTLQVRLPLYRVGTKGALEAHNGVGVCKEEGKLFRHLAFFAYSRCHFL